MQIPGTIRTAQMRSPAQRFATAAIVAAIHVGAITALVVGLNVKLTKFIPHDIDARVIAQQPQKPVVLPKPVPIHFTTPTVATAPEPVVRIKDDSGPLKSLVSTGPDKGFINVAATGIADTHSTPPYPPSARRLNREGVVLLKLTISPLGFVSDVRIENSSGYAELDRTAAEWVKTHWRYRPAMVVGHPVVSTAEASVRFSLKDER